MQWKKIWVKATFWLATELVLNLLGLDNLADYSEFLFEQEVAIAAHQAQIIVEVPLPCTLVDHNPPYRFTMALSV